LLEATSGTAGGQTVSVSATSQSIPLSDGSQSTPVTSATNFLYTPAEVIVSATIAYAFSVETTNLVKTFGTCGGACLGLTSARAAAGDANGDIFIEMWSSLELSQSYTVFVYPAGSTSSIESYGGTNGATGPGGIVADANRRLYIINQLSSVGTFPHRQETPAALNEITWGSSAVTTSLVDSTPTYLTGPVATAIDPSGRIYVVNQDCTVDVYPADPSSITPTTVINTSASVSEPTGIAADANGGIYVFDSGNEDIAYIAPGATTVTNIINDPSFANASGGIWFDGNENLNVPLAGPNDTEILAGSGLPSGQVTYLGYYPVQGSGGVWIP
jgi:hypothetical protein